MSVIIKDMKMPEDCRVCPMQIYDSYSGETKCRAIDKILAEDYKTIPFDGRPEYCPLIELPPHVRLIDADVLLDESEWYGERATYDNPMPDGEEAVSVESILNAPTIFEEG